MKLQKNQKIINGRNNGTLTPWNPGQSGNPAGRPKGSLNFTTILRELLDKEVEIEGVKVSQKQLMMMRLIQKAHGYYSPEGYYVEPDLKAIIEVMNRLEGHTVQSVQVEGDENSPVSAIMTVEVARQLKAFVDEVTSG